MQNKGPGNLSSRREKEKENPFNYHDAMTGKK